jgi:hypothetical protein
MYYMSSWANRGIFTKRNLSQIPEGLRPTIITRAQRPEVLISESFQMKEENEIIYPSGSKDDANSFPEMNAYARPSYLSRRVDMSPSPNAIELRHNDKSYVFVILRNIRITRDNDLWMSSYQSIRKFYTNKIIIIDDNSTINTVNGKLVNTEVIQSEYNGAGEILPYYYFLKNKWADTMIFFHDSMFLHRPFTSVELDGAVRFHWHFDNTGHDNRKMETYLSMLSNHNTLIEFMNQSNPLWHGCFGGASIIDWTIVEQLEKSYSFFSNLVMSIRSRKDRETFERLLGIVLYHEKLIGESISNFGNIMKYPGAFESQITTPDQGAYAISQKGYHSAIIKVWRGR